MPEELIVASEKLTILKRQKFRQAGRQARIEASLAALNAPQPTNLAPSEWKALTEEIENED